MVATATFRWFQFVPSVVQTFAFMMFVALTRGVKAREIMSVCFAGCYRCGWFTIFREAVMTTQRELNTALRHAISSSSEQNVAIILPW